MSFNIGYAPRGGVLNPNDNAFEDIHSIFINRYCEYENIDIP